MRVLVQHRSRYRYPRPALLGPQVIRLRPADHARARVESYRLDVTPEHRVHWQRDPHGNHVARVTFKAGQRIESLDLVVELALDVRPVNPFDFFVDARAKTAPFRYPDELAGELAAFLDTGDPAYRLGRRAIGLLGDVPASQDTIDLLVALNAQVKQRVAYVIRDEPGVWTPEDTLANGRGSCRDSAALLVALLRARGIAARFVSGYLVQLADEGMIPNEPKGVARDVVDLHAWAEAYVPGAGWIGLDGTSGLLTGEGHLPLACTASPAHAAPLDGTSELAAERVEFSTTICRLGHEARPTAPFTDATWDELLAASDRADQALVAAGLALTVGGEPTFVARDGQAAEEWQGGALGPDKWRRGRALAGELRDRLAAGGIVLHRMGKQYPGESLPRWALDVIARDGAPLWPARPDLRHEVTRDAARRLGERIAAQLGCAPELHAAFEDPWEVVRAEAALPVELDPRAAGLDDPDERRRLAAVLDRGAGEIVGWVLPIARDGDAWRSARWRLRRSELFLVPGESPIGLRLPLASLDDAEPQPAWADAPEADDPRQDKIETGTATAGTGPSTIRTALCIEPRGDTLWVFVPPCARGSEFVALIGAIERARAELGVACELEGYAPPPSPELRRFAITPDPGVLEVNLPPVATGRAAAELHAAVFDAALACGLTSERYLLDGRAAGSGGGNHITLGGPAPLASPWLQRPDVLASAITFVQHHPALSYLFSGLFVGPTSQAPRVDEARHDALVELELALPRLHDREQPPPAWLVDALLRHLLVDVAGSTHRAELSIDKLFDPHAPFGRQGLVELRAFEMPPHPRMAAAQVILARALVTALAAAPYRHALVRWGGELHDRFLLPFWMWRDFEDALAELARAGVELPAGAYRPFVELRCPLIGALDAGGGTLELRNAIEPWHVLGEETTRTGTARYVDSSLERVELRAIGLDEERYVVAVNGIAVPLRRAGGRDVRVGGVRFRAWCPPHALQPHLGIHHPLRVDVVDTWAERGVAGAAYHVWHPEGRAFDAPPLTRVEAAARRAQRFTLAGPSPSPLRPRRVAPHPDQPYTLDLRAHDAGAAMPRAEDWARE
ncbi:MAG TPA: transglutaminase family protein [Kofleriaceae bacterium]|nr:transglutaminase family protein [Kofleriaceae bacterium]